MSADGQTLAGVKNRVTKSQLISELYRIEKEQKAEMRMHNTLKQRFRAKYSKLNYYDKSKDACDVRMYETHTPGFCYRRNGECKIPQISPTNTAVAFNDIHSLLFTNGEIDIDKIICLHLLSAHRTETLTPPQRYNRSNSLAKDQSPLEKLIERSKKKKQKEKIAKLLPTYIVDIKTENLNEKQTMKRNDVLITDGRLAARVIVNDKIIQLIHTVVSALETSNSNKMKELLDVVKDPKIIKTVIEKPHIQEYLNSLNGQMLVSSCESFHLTQPFKTSTVTLEVEKRLPSLEKLVNNIRKNVLQLPVRSHETQTSYWVK